MSMTELENNTEKNEFEKNSDLNSEINLRSNLEDVNIESGEVAGEVVEDETINFAGLSFEELASKFADLVQLDAFYQSRTQFRAIKDRFNEIVAEHRESARQQFLSEGGADFEFEYVLTPEMEDFKKVLENTQKKFQAIRREREQALQENYLKKEDLIQELKKIIQEEENINLAFDKFNEIREKWNQTGSVPAAKAEDLYNRYNHFVKQFYDSVKINKDLYKMELKKNLEKKLHIVKSLENLINEPSIKKSMDMLRRYQKEWRESGPIPKSKHEEIWARFKKAYDLLIKRRNDFIKEQQAIRTENLNKKTALCEQAEEIAAKEFSTLKDFKEWDAKFEELEAQWKKIGRVPEAFNEAIWTRFKNAKRAYQKKKNPIYEQLNESFQKNLEAKIKLCEKVEGMTEISDWKKATQTVIKYQNDWKKIGPAPRKQSDEVWKRFRAACDAFFEKKQAHIAEMVNEENQNLAAKLALIEEIKAYKSENVEEVQGFISEIKEKWNGIGFVPFKEKASLEKQFEKALGLLYSQAGISESQMQRLEFKDKLSNLQNNKDAIKKLREEKSFHRKRYEKVLEEISQLENNISFFGNSKNAENLIKPYLDQIAKKKEILAEEEDKMRIINTLIKQIEKRNKQ